MRSCSKFFSCDLFVNIGTHEIFKMWESQKLFKFRILIIILIIWPFINKMSESECTTVELDGKFLAFETFFLKIGS